LPLSSKGLMNYSLLFVQSSSVFISESITVMTVNRS